jgi:hypothetical protein
VAACTFRVGTADTGATPNTSGAFVPATGDLLVVLFCASASAAAAQATWTVTSSIGGFTFSAVTRGGGASSTDRLQVFVSDALVSDTSSQTVTVSNTSDEGNGSIIFVYSVSGMARAGTGAIRQFKARGPELSSVGLEVVFDAACLTDNPTLVVMTNASNPAAVSPPTNWTENASGDLGYSNPTQGAECAHRDSGFTGTTVTWATNSASAWGAIIVELDAPIVIAPGVGSGTFSGSAPTVSVSGGSSNTDIPVAAGSVTSTGYAALAPTTLPVGAGSITSTGYSALVPTTLPVGAGSGTFTGYAPTDIDSGAVDHTAEPAKYSATVTGYAPSLLSDGQPDVGAGTFSGYTPTRVQTENHWATPDTGSGAFEGYSVDLLQPGSVIPDAGSGVFEGYAPSLVETEPEAGYSETPAGRGGGRRRRYTVEIDGQEFVVGSVAEAIALLDRAAALAETAAAKSAEQVVEDALRKARRIGKVSGVTLKPPTIRVAPELRDALSASQRAIEQAYKDAAIAAEIQALLAFEAEMDDEDILLLL